MEALERILNLVTDALDGLDDPNTKLSVIIPKAIRIARLRSDYDNLWWLEWEMISSENKDAKRRIAWEIIPHYTEERHKLLMKRLVEAYGDERALRSLDRHGNLVNKDEVYVRGVEELEARLEYLERCFETAVPPAGLHPVDLYFVDQEKSQVRVTLGALAQDARMILSRIRQRVHDFLSATEHQLIYGQLNSDIFEHNRRFVDSRLHEIAPKALDKFVTIYQRLREDDPEARSHALTSCRRLLKDLADNIYPPSETPVKGHDGKERKLTEDRFVSRLWQFVAEKVQGRKSGDLLLVDIDDLGNRIDKINDLICKGVHAEVSPFEVNQCVIQTYLIVGDILRLYDQQSAISSEDVDLE